MSNQISSRSGQVSPRSCQCQIKAMPFSGQVMVGQYNVISRSNQVKVRRGPVISSSKSDQSRTSHGPVKVRHWSCQSQVKLMAG